MEEITSKQRQSLENAFRWRWLALPSFAFGAIVKALAIYDKRFQWPHLPMLGSFTSGAFFRSVWWDIVMLVIFSFNLVVWWFQVSRYRHVLSQEEIELTADSHPRPSWPPAPRI